MKLNRFMEIMTGLLLKVLYDFSNYEKRSELSLTSAYFGPLTRYMSEHRSSLAAIRNPPFVTLNIELIPCTPTSYSEESTYSTVRTS
jgi:hypothetical protein